MTDVIDRKLAELAARFDAQIAQIDAASAASRVRTSLTISLLGRLGARPTKSPSDAVVQRLADLAKLRKELLRQAKQSRANGEEWERRAMLAVKSGDDDLARESLHRQREALADAVDVEARAKQTDRILEELQRCVDKLERNADD